MLQWRKVPIVGSLIRFEIKKIVSRRVTQVTVGIILLMFLIMTWWNISSTYALDPDEFDRELEGTAAIEQIKMNADAFAGPITNERVTQVIKEYKRFIDLNEGEIKDEFRADSSDPGKQAEEYWNFSATHNAFLSLVVRPWMQGFQMPVSVAATIDTSSTVDLYGQIRAKVESQLDDDEYKRFTYTQAEKDFWIDRSDAVSTPIEYGYSGGWKDFLQMTQFLIFALIAVVIACASVFNIEYREKTDAVLLSTKNGKAELGWAKVIAATIVSSAIYWILSLTMLIFILVLFGMDGSSLPIQSWKILNTYSLSVASASLTCCFIGYAAMLGLLGIVLMASSKMRSSVGILAIGVAFVLIPMFIPNLQNNIANHTLYLFPYFALDPNNLFDLVSYSLGSLVVEYPIMLSILYLALFVIGSLLAARSFSKHQVA